MLMDSAWIAMAMGSLILVASMLSVELGISEVETIITAARDGKFDLLAVGFAGHSNVFGRVMGSTSQNLSRLSPRSVLIVK